jgi:glucosamine 6-phosphate synthetase-like amidotransferase/phosphosugar isomerase protein
MCGIAGYSRAERSSIPNGRKFARHLAEAIESRGRHATGFGWFEHDDTSNAWYAKKQGKATDVARQMALPSRGISVLCAHTRHFTKGDPSIYENNHPIVEGSIVATHNGRCDNDDELLRLTGAKHPGKSTVDSFAIAAALANMPALGANHVTEILEMVRGVAALAWLDADDHNVLHLARLSTRPLYIGWTKRGDLVYSSTGSTLRTAAQKGGIAVHDVVEVKEGTYLRVEQGRITEMVEFDVTHPPTLVKEDMPGVRSFAKQGVTKPATRRPLPPVPSFDPDEMAWWEAYDEWEADRKATGDALWENLTMDDDPMDDIDWANVLPRRGHAGFTG